MQNSMVKISGWLLAVMAFASIGCGKGMNSNEESMSSKAVNEGSGIVEPVAPTPVSIDQEMAKAEDARVAAQKAIDEANAALKTITDSKGNINLDLFKKQTKAAGVTTTASPIPGLTEKLRGIFDNVFAKVTTMRTKFNDARKNLADALAKLDSNDPAQALLKEKILTEMAKIDSTEASFINSIKGLASKLDLAVNGLDKLVSGITSFIPGFGWVAQYLLDWLVIDDVKMLILELKYKLMNL